MANSIDPDQLLRSEMSDLDLYCLLWSICPNMWNKYGNMIIKSNPSEILLDPPLMFILCSLHMASCLHIYSISNVSVIIYGIMVIPVYMSYVLVIPWFVRMYNVIMHERE